MKLIRPFLFLSGVVLLAGCTQSPTPLPSSSPSALPDSSPMSTTSSSESVQTTSYTMAEVSAHSTESDCWLVVNDSVYDVTGFVDQHPGGKEILKGCGKDATALFESKPEHQGPEAQDMLPTLKIGVVAN